MEIHGPPRIGVYYFGFRELCYGKEYLNIKNEILIGTVLFERNRWT